MLTWRIWISCPPTAPNCPQPRFRARDLHALWLGAVSTVTSLQAGKMYKRLVILQSDAKGFLVSLHATPPCAERKTPSERRCFYVLHPASFVAYDAGTTTICTPVFRSAHDARRTVMSRGDWPRILLCQIAI